ncbi:MAG: hypothetical protein FJ189_03205, partial [Gammaproteobacteria bacterium]|nr:hypothetical protein [Gammaproteobacteria bacterium]
MILRKRQQLFVQRCLAALAAHGNTLGTAPTGSGKTVCLSAVAGRVLTEPDAKVCILAHRDELTGQNRAKFSRVNPGVTTSVFDATEKSWDGQAVFAMVQTLSRENYLRSLPPLRMLVVDECFPAGTSIDGRAIESIRAGDRVRSFDHQQGAVVAREVTRIFRRRPSRLLQLRFDDGSVLVCTPEHPLFAPQAQRYIPAHEMVAGQEVLHLERGSDSKLCVVWAEHRDHHQESAPGISADRASVLFGRLSGCDRTADQQPDDGPDQSPLRGGTDDPQQPNVS